MLEDFLSKLGASTRITVGVSVSPGVGLEMAEVDRLTGTVNKYGFKPLEYNSSTRDISNYEDFRIALEELFEELHIPKRSNIVLSIPNTHFGIISLPLLLTDEAINNAIISEVEQSYIFKRQEPLISWSEISSSSNSENRTLAYTAIQKDSLEQITEICEEIGCSIVAIENSYASLFRALNFIDVAKDQMKENVLWNLMLIMQNNYSIFSVSNKRISEYYEEPLALKSFVNDEIYNAIKTSAQLTLSSLPANYLFIVSETDMVSAEVLSMKMEFDGSITFLECNKFIQNELMPISLNVLPKLAMQITPEVIGAAVYQFNDFPLKFNLAKKQDKQDSDFLSSLEECPRINVGNLEVELTPAFIKKVTLIIGAIIIVPMLLLFLFLRNVVLPGEELKLTQTQTKIESLNDEIKKYKDKYAKKDETFDLAVTIDKLVKQNKSKLTYYSALRLSVPNNLWITFYELKGDGKVDIQGQSESVRSIYIFYKTLKQLVNNSDVKLFKLEVAKDSLNNIISSNNVKLYSFEITNMSETELTPSDINKDDRKINEDRRGENEKEKKSIFQLGKPLFGSNDENEIKKENHDNRHRDLERERREREMMERERGMRLPENLDRIEEF